jgi:hypothetical protein
VNSLTPFTKTTILLFVLVLGILCFGFLAEAFTPYKSAKFTAEKRAKQRLVEHDHMSDSPPTSGH